MKKITALLVDDEATSIQNLTQLLQRYCPDVQVVATASNITGAEQAIYTFKPDLLFLDIEMPFGTGFQLLERLQGQSLKVIFTTAFDTYAVRAFRSNATDYLLKPIDVDQLLEAVDRIRQSPAAPNPPLHAASPLLPGKVRLPVLNGFELVEADQILFLQSSGNYTHLYLKSAQKYVLSRNLGEMEKVLPPHLFLRIHNEHIVNVNEIARYVKGRGGYVILKNDQHLDVSHRRKKHLLDALGY